LQVGNSTSGTVESPLWSYQLGLSLGYIPTDPRTAVGKCASISAPFPSFKPPLQPTQTGGAGAGNLVSTYVYPPDITAPGPFLPTYTDTGTVPTLPPTTLTAPATVTAGDGWYDAADTEGGVAAIAGCAYPDPWSAVDVVVAATAGCGANDGAVAAPVTTSAALVAPTTTAGLVPPTTTAGLLPPVTTALTVRAAVGRRTALPTRRGL
jgi:glucan 1,3-beta-glucosidase